MKSQTLCALAFLSLSLWATQSLAQFPTFSLGDLTCEEAEFEEGCYGSIIFSSQEIRLQRCLRLGRQFIRQAKISLRRARRQGDIDNESAALLRLENARNTKRECRQCWNYFDEECSSDNGGPVPTNACTITTNPNSSQTLSHASSSGIRIANGAVCQNAGASPVVAITFFGQPFCSGTVVAPNKVLTAAHCFADIHSADGIAAELSDGTSRAAASFVSNEIWSGGNSNEGDVAVLTLSSSFSGVNIPEIYFDDDFTIGDPVVMAGFGESETGIGTLRAVGNVIEAIDNIRIETYYELGQTDRGTTCVGDSGGPLFTQIGGLWQIIGVLSTGGPTECLINGNEANFDRSQWANITSGNNKAFIEANL